jgi:hypothetical protein
MLRSLSLRLVGIVVALPVVSHCLPASVGGSSAAMASAAALSASTQTSTVVDPVGDTSFNAPAFQDIVSGQLTKTATGDFELLMEMAGPVPANPPLPPPANNEIWWICGFDLDPTTFPKGYPASKGIALSVEFVVYVSWNGTAFAGTAVDRRPLLTGGEAIVTPVPFSIDGTMVEADLASALISGVPASFSWHLNTIDWAGPVGSGGWMFADATAETVFNP